MARQETGLGWYADGDWLTDQAGEVIATISSGSGGGSGYLDQPYFAKVAYNDSVRVTLSDARVVDIRNDSQSDMYYCVYYKDSSYLGTLGLFYENSDGAASVSVNGGPWSPLYVNPYPVVGTDSTIRSHSFMVAIYYITAAPIQILYPIPEWGVSDTDAATLLNYMVDHFSFSSGASYDFNKTSSGYSVVSFVKWRESLDGDVFMSPVLISTENTNTFWDIDGNVPIQQLTEHTFQGANFFMRLSKQYTADEYGYTAQFPVLDYSESPPVSSDLLFALIANASSLGVGYPPQDEDPYGPGGTSEPSQPNGDFDTSSDDIPDSPLPTYSFAASGFCRIYNPNLSQLSALANYMWTDQSFLQTVVNHLKQLLENPVDAVISLSMLPISIPNGSDEEVKIMYIPTGVRMPPATKQIVDVDCGSVFINEVYGSALDYNPYTKVSIFLPFIGMVDLDTDEVMDHTLYVKYRVDIVSGACTAKILVDGASDEKCLYQFSGDCSISMPLNSADFSAYRAAFIQAAKAVMTGMSAAGAAIDAFAEATEAQAQTAGAVSSAETSLVPFMDGPTVLHNNSPDSSEPTTIDVGKFGDMLLGAAQNTVGLVTSSKLSFQHASGFSGNSGILGVRRPYVVIKRPDMANPGNYGSYNGRPCCMYLSLAPLKGFTQMQRIHLTGFSATNPELSEIGEFLKNGVIL